MLLEDILDVTSVLRTMEADATLPDSPSPNIPTCHIRKSLFPEWHSHQPHTRAPVRTLAGPAPTPSIRACSR